MQIDRAKIYFYNKNILVFFTQTFKIKHFQGSTIFMISSTVLDASSSDYHNVVETYFFSTKNVYDQFPCICYNVQQSSWQLNAQLQKYTICKINLLNINFPFKSIHILQIMYVMYTQKHMFKLESRFYVEPTIVQFI